MRGAIASVRYIVGPTILLHSSHYFDFLAPETSAFTIDDVAHGLSQTCRFGGQCARFYSVAQHCVHVSEIVPVADAYAGLMHDAAEAFVGDVAKPLKDLMADYRAIERRVDAAVFARFAVAEPLPASVKEADAVMLVTERCQLMRPGDDWDDTRGRPPLAMRLPQWSPGDAKAMFLARYGALATAAGSR